MVKKRPLPALRATLPTAWRGFGKFFSGSPELGRGGLVLLLLASAVHAQTPLPDLPVVVNQTLSLRDALTLARQGSVTLQQMRADAGAASANARSAQAQTRPSLSTTTYATVGDSSNILTTSPGVTPQNLFVVPARGFADQNLMLMVPLFTGGKLESAAASAQKQAQAAGLTIEASRLTVTESVVEAYADAALGQSLTAAAQARLDAENEQVRITEEKVNAGRSAPVDGLREQAEQADARQALLAAQNTAALALVTLKTTLGVSQASAITLSDTLDSLSGNAPLPADLPAALHLADTRRPELAASARQRQAAQAALKAAQGESAPQVYGVAMGDAMTMPGGSRVGYTLGVTASLPLSDGGARRADVDAAQARLDRADADARQARQTVEQETASAWLNQTAAAAQIQSAQMGLTAAQEAYRLADLHYNAGKSVTAERLDALAALTRAQGALAQAKAGEVIAQAKLAAATGGN